MMNFLRSEKTKISFILTMLVIVFISTVSLSFCASIKEGDNEDKDLFLAGKTSSIFSKIAKQAMPTVVFISVEETLEGLQKINPFNYNNPFDLYSDDFFNRFFRDRFPHNRQPKRFKKSGQGSGFIVSEEGYIITNHHVVGKADEIRVTLNDGREFKAELVGTDPKSDIAIIKIKGGKDLPFLPLGDSDAMEVGDWVMAIGNPFGFSHTMTVGIVSAKGRSGVGITDYEDFIQTDAAINPGNSGGPLINMNGEAIGINSAIFSKNGGYMGIGFAIPINMAKVIKDQIIEHGEVSRGYLGVMVQSLTKDLRKSFGLGVQDGVLIADVTENSPAEKAKLRRGDVIIEYDGRKVSDVSQFRNMVAITRPEKEIKIKIIRAGKTLDIPVSLGILNKEEVANATQTNIMKKIGLSVQNLTKELAERFGYEMGKGVLVTEITPGSLAQYAGISEGMLILEVNNKQISSVSDFNEALEKSEKNKQVLMLLRDDKFSRYVTLILP